MPKSGVILSIIIIWIAFITWEITVHQWAKTQTGPIIRIDLVIILPGLIGLTIHFVMRLIKEYKQQ